MIRPFEIERVKRFHLVNADRLTTTLKKALGLKKNRDYSIEIIVSEKPRVSGSEDEGGK